MPTQTQPWLRAELIAAPETTPGAQLMIPADGIEFHDGDLVFHHQGDVVYVAPQGQLRSITWFARQPHPETARRKAQWPNHGTRWTDEERTDLQRHLQAGHSWKTISHAHGRSRSGCQQEAVKQGWLDPETLAPTPKLLGDEAPSEVEAAALAADGSTSSPDTNAQVVTEPSAAAAAAPPGSPTNTALAEAAPADSPAGSNRAGASAGPAPNTVLDTASAGSPTSATLGDSPLSPPLAEASVGSPTSLRSATTPADSPAGPTLASASAGPAPKTALADDSADSPPKPGLPGALANSPTAVADSALSLARASAPADSPPLIPASPPPAFVLPKHAAVAGSDPIPAPYADLAQAAVTIAREARSVPDTAPDPDDHPEKDAPPGPGSRFLSRAQSSLARATLGAYMNPPRAT